MPIRKLRRIFWAWQLWRIRRQRPPSSATLIAEIDRRRQQHKPVRELQQHLTRRVHQEMRQ